MTKRTTGRQVVLRLLTLAAAIQWASYASYSQETPHPELIIQDGHSSPVYSVSFGPDGKMLASGSVDQTIKLWEVSSGRLIRSLEGHSGHVYSVAFSPDGKMLASGDLDQTIKLWEVSSGRLIRSLEGHSGPVHSVAFSPDGKMLASGGSDQAIKLWEVSSSSCEPTTDHRVMKVNWNRQRIADSKVNDNRQRS